MNIILIILPLISSVLCGLFGRFLGIKGVKVVSLIIMFIVFLDSWIIFYESNFNNYFNYYYINSWFNLGLFNCSFTFKFDLITNNMIILVSTISFFVHIFSYDYMKSDPHLPRFISYLSLFTFFMLVLITSANLIQLFIGWEGVGLCSYLLINFWYNRIQANKSAIKAMVINKIGDIGFLWAILLLWILCGSLEISDIILILSNKNNSINLFIPLLLLLIGIMGKSAQLGLHIWLPDAMEGPTPVSALIHAATMVTAGVLLIIRMSPLFELNSSILILVIIIGSLTSFFSATIGMVQNDLKKVIAYSTCSQLGYMIWYVGFYYNISLFHLINHGFFKALYFLSAGSIIHFMNDEQDIRKYGSLITFNPIIFIFIFVGSIALMGLPFLSGFYSKDLIIEIGQCSYFLTFSFWLSLIAVFFTSFYSIRLIFFIFLKNPQETKHNFMNSYKDNYKIIIVLSLLTVLSIISGYIFQYIIIKDNFLLIINNFNKILPLTFTILGIIYCILLYFNYNNIWYFCLNKNIKLLAQLVFHMWLLDAMINNYFFRKFLFIGYSITYKLIDNQILEYLGPFYVHNKIIFSSNKLSKFYINNIYSYLLSSFIFFIFFILIFIS
uniref:NADH-ubiquinone oxidoreductase chain 5 n=1 Tax=Hydra sinensis TaxID=570418 RepID=R4IXA8_9CNID|nr:NADH dehydrogenase subunit 5 [Hydra sinensis]AGE65905.1 NADH dehydrogenase subunit 5 [Hydra sinensis]